MPQLLSFSLGYTTYKGSETLPAISTTYLLQMPTGEVVTSGRAWWVETDMNLPTMPGLLPIYILLLDAMCDRQEGNFYYLLLPYHTNHKTPAP